MGMSKLIAENYIVQLSQKSGTQFSITRFGNIMGSNGSVLPLFKKQLDSGLPLTLTSETASRYFIDKYKACNLILKIATFNKLEGQIFTFNMGDPIKLMDLANCVIDCFPEKKEAVEIKITGLRTGEKHHEEIISKNELLSATTDIEIFIAFSNTALNE